MARWYKGESGDWYNLDMASIAYVEKNDKFSGYQMCIEINSLEHCLGYYSTKESAQKTLDNLLDDGDEIW